MTSRYRHVGTQPIVVDGRAVKPGEVFEAELAPERAAFLVEIGAIAIESVEPPVEELPEDGG